MLKSHIEVTGAFIALLWDIEKSCGLIVESSTAD
jgi:hypothetical protein